MSGRCQKKEHHRLGKGLVHTFVEQFLATQSCCWVEETFLGCTEGTSSPLAHNALVYLVDNTSVDVKISVFNLNLQLRMTDVIPTKKSMQQIHACPFNEQRSLEDFGKPLKKEMLMSSPILCHFSASFAELLNPTTFRMTSVCSSGGQALILAERWSAPSSPWD